MRVEDEEEGEVEVEAAEVVGGDPVDPAGCQGHPGESACRCCLQTQEHELNIPQHGVYSLHTSALKPLSSHLPKIIENLGDTECQGVVKFTVKSKILFYKCQRKVAALKKREKYENEEVLKEKTRNDAM